MTEKTRFKDGGMTFPPGTTMRDLPVEQFMALVRQGLGETATKAGPGPKMTPADPMDASLERLRQACVDAAQRIGDAQLSKEIESFSARIRSLAGIQSAASTTLTDNQAPMPTTKATQPAEPFAAFVQAFKAPASAANPNVFADTFGWAEAERE